MGSFLAAHRRLLTATLALIGIATMAAYVFCLGACSYLKGAVLGIDLKYIGIAYLGAVLALSLLGKALPCLLLLAFGAGGEIFLVGYQVRAGVYCPYCLTFGATVVLALIVNFDRGRKGLTALAVAAGLGFFLLFFSGSTTPAYAADPPLTQFGKGPTEVRVYTDYFCGPCGAEEHEAMSLVANLVDRNMIRVLFIDVPVHKETVLYAGYFLAALQAVGKPDIHRAVEIRAALFAAAAQKMETEKTEAKKGEAQKADLQKARDKEAIEQLFNTRKIHFRPFEPTPVFNIYSRYLQEDQINATPTFVIVYPQRKLKLTGKDEIAKGLRELGLGIAPTGAKAP